jgi:hypothetical protein
VFGLESDASPLALHESDGVITVNVFDEVMTPAAAARLERAAGRRGAGAGGGGYGGRASGGGGSGEEGSANAAAWAALEEGVRLPEKERRFLGCMRVPLAAVYQAEAIEGSFRVRWGQRGAAGADRGGRSRNGLAVTGAPLRGAAAGLVTAVSWPDSLTCRAAHAAGGAPRDPGLQSDDRAAPQPDGVHHAGAAPRRAGGAGRGARVGRAGGRLAARAQARGARWLGLHLAGLGGGQRLLLRLRGARCEPAPARAARTLPHSHAGGCPRCRRCRSAAAASSAPSRSTPTALARCCRASWRPPSCRRRSRLRRRRCVCRFQQPQTPGHLSALSVLPEAGFDCSGASQNPTPSCPYPHARRRAAATLARWARSCCPLRAGSRRCRSWRMRPSAAAASTCGAAAPRRSSWGAATTRSTPTCWRGCSWRRARRWAGGGAGGDAGGGRAGRAGLGNQGLHP